MQMDILDSYGNCKMELVVEWQQSNYDYSYPYRQVQKLNPFVVMVHSFERGSSKYLNLVLIAVTRNF